MATSTSFRLKTNLSGSLQGRAAAGKALRAQPLRQRKSHLASKIAASFSDRDDVNDRSLDSSQEPTLRESREQFLARRREMRRAETDVASPFPSEPSQPKWKLYAAGAVAIAGATLLPFGATAAPPPPPVQTMQVATSAVDSTASTASTTHYTEASTVTQAMPVYQVAETPPAAATPAEPVTDSGDTAWMMTSTALVLAMTIPGLSMFYGGLVGSKNVLSIFMICFTMACMMSLLWFGCGYSLAFSTGGNAVVGGLDKAFLAGVTALSPAVETIPEGLWVMFQGTFAIIAPALIVGSFAERFKFSALVVFCLGWAVTVYFPFAHMVWGGGYLESLGLIDFAGGIVVHLTAGAAALVACIMVGPRKKEQVGEPHNLPMVIVGTGMLWVGWFGFNAGSAVAANSSACMAMIATQAAAAAAGTTWMLLDWGLDGKPTTLGICTGAVAGLVAITPGAGFVSPVGAAATGVLAGVICRWWSTTGKRVFGYDDALDVWGVHGVGGFLGNQTTAIFGATAFGGTEVVASVAKQFGVHMYASCFAIAWSCAATFVILKIVDATIGIVPTDDEIVAGLDKTDHGEEGYILS